MVFERCLKNSCLLLTLLWPAPVSTAKSQIPTPSINFSRFAKGTGHDLPFRLGNQLKWTALARSPYACIIPSKRAVFYTESYPGSRRTALRSFDGKMLWTNPDSPPEFDDYHDLVAGGDSILGAPGGPVLDSSKYDDLHSWRNYLKATPVTLMSLKNGVILWELNREEVGFPILE